MKIFRYLQDKIKANLGKRKILIIYGPRQVGKTTLVKEFLSAPNSVYYNCDQDETRILFEEANLEKLGALVRKYDTVVIDEAQKVTGVGLSLKIIVDNFPEKNYIVTGSSSFDLANSVSEPLTGRFFSYTMFPIAELELTGSGKNPIELRESLESRLIYGSYPEVITASDYETKKEIIKNIASNYLFKDILVLGVVRNPDDLRRLLQALALQSGQEVSHTELAQTLRIDKNTVKRYLEICEKLYILFSLPPFVSNKRKSISMMKKYYFYDLGIRNALINNFNPLTSRNDVGALWENYMIAERMKWNAARGFDPTYYFFRSYDKQEIDLFEDEGGVINGYEFKFTKDTISRTTMKVFDQDIKGKRLELINKDNYPQFIQNI